MSPTDKLKAILTKARIPHISCFLGGLGSCHVVCRSDSAARRASALLSSAGFRIRGITTGRAKNKTQKGTRLIESHETHTVHARL